MIFVEPLFPANQSRFVRALAEVGAKVSAIGEAAGAHLPAGIRECLADYRQVSSVCDEEQMLAAVRSLQRQSWVDRLEATVEAHVLPVAKVRAAAGIPGTSVRTAYLCRDKPAMKDALRAVGVPCAQSTGAASAAEVRVFAERVGYPLILKPRGAAGAAGTERVDDPAELEAALPAYHLDRGGEVAVEEFIEGHEGFFDSLAIDGKIVHGFICHYYPGVLEAMRTRWISPYLITTNRVEADGYREVWELGERVIEALGIGTSATHMEWFFGPKGMRFSEIGCRPPGVSTWDLYSAANDFDIYREWARAIVNGRIEERPSRRFAAALITFRPSQDGRIVGYQGVEDVQRAFSEWILDHHFPAPGTPTQPVSAGYMANAWMRMRHPDYDRLREMLDIAGRTIRVLAA